MKLWTVVKSGKLANGHERGKGAIIHLVFGDEECKPYFSRSLCGEQPTIQWTETRYLGKVCLKCAKEWWENEQI